MLLAYLVDNIGIRVYIYSRRSKERYDKDGQKKQKWKTRMNSRASYRLIRATTHVGVSLARVSM